MGALEDFDAAREEFARLVALVKIADLDAATPCAEWNVRQLLNHVVTGTQWFACVILDEVTPDRSIDQILDDPSGAFARRADEFRAAISAPGAMERMYSHPSGEVPGDRYTLMRTNEYLCHGWDLAMAIDTTPAFDDASAGRCLQLVESQLAGRAREPGKGFGIPLPAPAGGDNYARLLSFVGRDASAW